MMINNKRNEKMKNSTQTKIFDITKINVVFDITKLK